MKSILEFAATQTTVVDYFPQSEAAATTAGMTSVRMGGFKGSKTLSFGSCFFTLCNT